MADFVFNISLGRGNEYLKRVDSNDPTNAVLVIVALKSAGLEADGTLRDYDTLAAILAAANDEATNSGYVRKVLNESNVAFGTPDDANNRLDADIPTDPVWTAVAATGGAWGKLLVCYDPDSTVTDDSTIIPWTAHDFAVTPDGQDITAQVNSAGFFRAAGA